MLEGSILIVILIAAVLFIVVSSSVFKLHPFMGLLLASFGVGLAVGMPLPKILEAITKGFGGILGTIGIIVVLGSIIGVILERSGAAQKIASLILGVLGKKRPVLAMSVIGAVVGIPVFCDSGFIILSGMARALAKKSKVHQASMSLALSSGLYATHTLVPPTPGPIAAAGNLGASDYLGTIILVGLVTAVPAVFATYIYAMKVGKKIETQQIKELAEEISQNQKNTSALKSIAPIAVPILLITLASITKLLYDPGSVVALILFLGQPIVALMIGLFFAFALFPRWDEEHLHKWIEKGILQAGPILMLTGAGGAFGSLLQATPLTPLISGWVTGSQGGGGFFLVIAFFIAAFLKTSQGSSTSALVIASSLLAPLVPGVGLDSAIGFALVVMALGGGAMTVSHANDSYFWVVSQMSGFSLKDAVRGFTVLTLLQGLTVLMTTLAVFYMFM